VIGTADGWLQVRLPGRQLGKPAPPATGWIAALKTRLRTNAWKAVLVKKARRLSVYAGDRRVRSFRVVIGRPSTPTQSGEFFVEERLALTASTPGAPYALALSARSSVYKEFEGGPGQLAIHSVSNLGGRPGTAVSHGCIRISKRNDRWVAKRLKAGTPITIS
jgi:lipoprotein-anchoring transpeptidase ErfK/SrfK